MNNSLHPKPLQYDYVFYFSKTELIATIVLPLIFGFGMLYWGYLSLMDKHYTCIIQLIMGLGFLYFSVAQGWIPLLNMAPQIKLSKAGIWTKKLGFKPWEDINNIAVVKLGKPGIGGPGGGYRTHLQIYVGQNTDLENPDESLFIETIKDSDKIEGRIKELRPEE